MSDHQRESGHPGESPADPWAAEATRAFGPPEVRAKKNRRYVARLVRKHREQTVRALLQALSTLKEPTCCENLSKHDLKSVPLDEVIRPYELLGLHFSIKPISDTQVVVEMGEAYGDVGSGGKFLLERVAPDFYRVVEVLETWIA